MNKKTKYISKKKQMLFGKYYKKPVISVPYPYLHWMLKNLDLSIWEQQVIDKILSKKAERAVQNQVLKDLRWLK